MHRHIDFVFGPLARQALVYLRNATYSTDFIHATTAGGPPILLGFILAARTIVAAVLGCLGLRSSRIART